MSESPNLTFYEQVLVLRPECSEPEQKEICQITAQIVKKQKGELFKMDTWGSRPIANPKAQKATRGFYFYMLFSADSTAIAEIRRQISINSKVLYFHQEKLPRKTSPDNHIKNFLQGLELTAQKEKERIARSQKKQNNWQAPRA